MQSKYFCRLYKIHKKNKLYPQNLKQTIDIRKNKWYYYTNNEYIALTILMEGKQNRQKDVTINGTSEIYSKLIFQ